MTAQLRDVLATLGESMPDVRLTPDVWRRGRRARRRARLLRSGLAVLLLALILVLPWSLTESEPFTAGADGEAVPAELSLPWMWQATVQMDPPGPASVLFGGDSIGLRGSDWYDSEGKIAVVGRNGDYRMLLFGGWNAVAAGEDVLLSPDGTRVAHPNVVGSGFSGEGLLVTDLTTGKTTGYSGGQASVCCSAVAWAPDGRSLIAKLNGDRAITDPRTRITLLEHRLVLLDLTTDTLRPLGEFRSSHGARTASRGAFAPDGERIAVSEGTTVRLIDRASTTLWTAELGDRRYLAGVGAFSPDGTRIATVVLDGCLNECDEAALAARRWAVEYLDAATGQSVSGPPRATVTGMAVRALGWTSGGDLVVVRYLPEHGARKTATTEWNDTGWYETGDVTLLALRPDGSTRVLLDPPDAVLTLDIARDLLMENRFGGPSSTASMFPPRPIVLIPVVPIIVAAALGIVLLIIRRVRRAAAPGKRTEP
jgi:hypothetical protein